MVVILQDNLTVTKPADFVLEAAQLKLTVLEHKEPIAWPTVFASTVETTLIVQLTTLGAETEFQELSAETICASLPVIPILVQAVPTHVVLINLTATATETVFDAPVILAAPHLMDHHQEVQTLFAMLLESVLTHGSAPLADPTGVTLTILDVKLTSRITTMPTVTKMELAPTVKQMLVVKPTMVVPSLTNLVAIQQPKFAQDVFPMLIVQLMPLTVMLMDHAEIAEQ